MAVSKDKQGTLPGMQKSYKVVESQEEAVRESIIC
jgi:hypothetical protein